MPKFLEVTNRAAARAAVGPGSVDFIATPTARQFGGDYFTGTPSTYTSSVGQIVRCDSWFADFTVLLPASPAEKGSVTVKRIDTNPLYKVTVQTQGSHKIGRSDGPTTLVLSVPSQSVTLQYVSGVWHTVTSSVEQSNISLVHGSPADRLIGRMTVPPSSARRIAIEGLIGDLSDCGVWDKLDALYMFAAHDWQAALLNWKSATVEDAVAVNAPLFTVDRGFTGDGATSYIDTNTAPSDFIQYKASDATLGVYVRTAVTLNVSDVTGAPTAQITTANNSTDGVYRINSTSFFSPVHGGDRTGLFAVSRLPSENRGFAYKDGALMAVNGSDSQSAGTLPSIPFAFLRHPTSVAYSTRQLAAGFWGAGLTAAEHVDLNTALKIYLTTVGAAV